MGLLIEQMEIDIENSDYDRVSEYEKILDSLRVIFQEQYIKEYEDVFKELKADADDCYDFEAIKAETLHSTGDEDLAEDIAWELVYAK